MPVLVPWCRGNAKLGLMVGACVTKKVLILWNTMKIYKKGLTTGKLWTTGKRWPLVRQLAPLPSLRWHPPSVDPSDYPIPICSTHWVCKCAVEFQVGLWEWRRKGIFKCQIFRHDSGVLSSYAVRRFEHVHPFLLPKVWCGRNQGLGHHKNVPTNHDSWWYGAVPRKQI